MENVPSVEVLSPNENQTYLRLEILPHLFQRLSRELLPRFQEMTEDALRKELFLQLSGKTQDFSFFVKLKIIFWEEYDKAILLGKNVTMDSLCKGLCNRATYPNLFNKFPALFSWVTCPPLSSLVHRKELESLAEDRMVEILSVSAVREDGKVDSRLAKVQVDMYAMLQDRLYGAVTQKIESQQKNLNVNINSEQSPEQLTQTISALTDITELNKRLEAVKQRKEALQRVIQPIEIDQQKLVNPNQIKE